MMNSRGRVGSTPRSTKLSISAWTTEAFSVAPSVSPSASMGRALLRAITLQLVTSRDPESWAISTFQRGWCSHVDSVLDDGPCGGRTI
jgi:hypothetical protein